MYFPVLADEVELAFPAIMISSNAAIHLGEEMRVFSLGDTFRLDFTTHDPANYGMDVAADVTPTYVVFKAANDTPIISSPSAAAPAVVLRSGLTNGYRLAFALDPANGFIDAEYYALRITAVVGTRTYSLEHDFQITSGFARSSRAIRRGTVTTSAFTPTATQFESSDINDNVANAYKNTMIVFDSDSSLAGIRVRVNAYSRQGSNGRFTVSLLDGATGMPAAPLNADKFSVV
jgi:hypothetical protein